MSAENVDARGIYTDRLDSYLRFIGSVGYARGLRAYFGRAPTLRSGMRILDAGCGTGVVSLALRDALEARGLRVGAMDGFDLTPAMLERFRATLEARAIEGVRLAEADVLELHALPESWTGYDLVVTASMLEYVPTARLPEALAGLRRRLDERGMLVLVITKRNWMMNLLIGRWWDAHRYTREELRRAFDRAGFARVTFSRFPTPWRHLDVWGHIVEAQP